MSIFDLLLAQIKAIYSAPEATSEFVGALLRPMADCMKEMIKANEPQSLDENFQAAKEASYQLIKKGNFLTISNGRSSNR